MKYPSIVYKDGGDHKRNGGYYSFRAVLSDADLKAAKKLGWFETLLELEESLKKKPEKTKPKPAPEITINLEIDEAIAVDQNLGD